MTPNKPDVNPTSRYTQAETAKHLGVHRQTIRRWTREGKITPIIQKVNNQPRYKGTEIIRVWSDNY